MPIDLHRREAIAAAIAAYDAAHPSTPLPRNTARLLAIMFPAEDACQRSLDDLAADGVGRKRLPSVLRRLVEAGFLSRHRVSGAADTYRLYLPPVQS